MANWQPVGFDQLDGWENDDHLAAFACFRMSSKAFATGSTITRRGVAPSEVLVNILKSALDAEPAKMTNEGAKAFFEANFQPAIAHEENGFVTAYFEPEVLVSRVRTEEYPYPLYRRPDDLVRIDDSTRPADMPASFEFARQTRDGLTEYFDRGEIETGELSGRNLELFWLGSQVEGFYIHVQGPARLQLTAGRSLAVDKSIHPYGTPVWLSTEKPLPSNSRPFRRLMIAQDTGSAIVGPARGDIFIGSGNEAGLIAGSVRHRTDFVIFQPKAS